MPLETMCIRMVSQQNHITVLASGFTQLQREGGVHDLYIGFILIICKWAIPALN